jgi:hypothetical protein
MDEIKPSCNVHMQDLPKETKRTVIMKKYENLMDKLKKLSFVKEEEFDVLPTINKDNLPDVLWFFRWTFTHKQDGFRDELKTIMSLKGTKKYSDEEFEQLFELISPFLLFLDTFY